MEVIFEFIFYIHPPQGETHCKGKCNKMERHQVMQFYLMNPKHTQGRLQKHVKTRSDEILPKEYKTHLVGSLKNVSTQPMMHFFKEEKMHLVGSCNNVLRKSLMCLSSRILIRPHNI